MNDTSSGVAISAAKIRSPSFSRSSSSTTTTHLPGLEVGDGALDRLEAGPAVARGGPTRLHAHLEPSSSPAPATATAAPPGRAAYFAVAADVRGTPTRVDPART